MVVGFGGDVSDMQYLDRLLNSLDIRENYSSAENPLNAKNLPQPVRRTSAGYALHGGGIGALNAANAIRRHASNTSNGTLDGAPAIPLLSKEAMNTNYEEWMKMATDNVSEYDACLPWLI